MAQTSLGAAKVVARKAGLSLRAYLGRVARGFKFCWRCRRMHDRAAFDVDPSRRDGLNPACRSSRNVAARASFKRSDLKKLAGYYLVSAREGDKKQARRRVNHWVEIGMLPNPNDLKCCDCGHLGDDKRHEYDHHRGYAAAHQMDVEAVCSTCHGLRGAARRRT